MNKVYSEEERNFIKNNLEYKDKDLWVLFNSTFGKNLKFATFRKLRQRIGVKKKNGRPTGKTN